MSDLSGEFSQTHQVSKEKTSINVELAKKQAEIIEQLRAKEAQTVQQVPNIPEPDQQRVTAEPVEVKVPIVTEDNAVSAAPLHQALEDLAREMGAKNPPGQVEGINEVHRQMPGHPLRDQDQNHG